MKLFLLIAFVFYGLTCTAQSDTQQINWRHRHKVLTEIQKNLDSSIAMTEKTNAIIDSISGTLDSINSYSVLYDTAVEIQLEIQSADTIPCIMLCSDTNSRDGAVFTITGYKVSIWWPEVECYLDGRKKRLPDNIIVWTNATLSH